MKTNTPEPSNLASGLQPFVDAGTLAGAVLLAASNKKVLALETLGFADIAARAPMTPDTLFWVASMTKPMTATALMMLVDEGRVNVGDPVEKYLPEFKGQMMIVEQDAEHLLLRPPSHPITVHEILSHTSGLPFQSRLERPTLDLLPLKVAAGSYAMEPLRFDPGSKYEYANAGTNTAGRIIEVISGMAYDDFLRERLFAPLGMNDTSFVPNPAQLARLAKSYKPTPDNTGLAETTVTQLLYPLSNPARQPMPAGGLFSTATDLASFCRMLLNGGELDGKRYISKASLKRMTSKQTGPHIEKSYGYGWDTADGNFGHGGAFATQMRINPGRGLITIFLVQHCGFPGDAGKSHEIFVQAATERF